MTNNRIPLLKAMMVHWDCIGPGDWVSVEWHIFRDGYYEIISESRSVFETWEMLRDNILEKKETTGQMEAEAFSNLRKALTEDPWRDPSVVVDACDGVAWEIESYREDGSLDKSSGKCDYIYGHRVLENIVSLLPSDGTRYDSSAFISISRKEAES